MFAAKRNPAGIGEVLAVGLAQDLVALEALGTVLLVAFWVDGEVLESGSDLASDALFPWTRLAAALAAAIAFGRRDDTRVGSPPGQKETSPRDGR